MPSHPEHVQVPADFDPSVLQPVDYEDKHTLMRTFADGFLERWLNLRLGVSFAIHARLSSPYRSCLTISAPPSALELLLAWSQDVCCCSCLRMRYHSMQRAATCGAPMSASTSRRGLRWCIRQPVLSPSREALHCLVIRQLPVTGKEIPYHCCRSASMVRNWTNGVCSRGGCTSSASA